MAKQEKNGGENAPEKTKDNVSNDSIEPKQKTDAEIDSDIALRMAKKKTLVAAAEYWKFDENPVFIGKYLGEHINENESTVIGYDFLEYKSKEVYIITNSHSIEKAVNHPDRVNDPDALLMIEFLGKIDLEGGRTFNKFKIDLL